MWDYHKKMNVSAARLEHSFFRCGYPPNLLAILSYHTLALLRLPLNTVSLFQPLMESDSAGIAFHQWFPQLRRVAQPPKVFVLTPVFLRENVRCKVKGGALMAQERNRLDNGYLATCPSRKKLRLPDQLDLYMEDGTIYHVHSFFAEEKRMGEVLDALSMEKFNRET